MMKNNTFPIFGMVLACLFVHTGHVGSDCAGFARLELPASKPDRLFELRRA